MGPERLDRRNQDTQQKKKFHPPNFHIFARQGIQQILDLEKWNFGRIIKQKGNHTESMNLFDMRSKN